MPDFTKVFRIQCDDSDHGLGSIFLRDRRVIGYYSKKFDGTELNYTIVEKEMFALLKTLEFYRPLIHGFPIII